MKFCTRCGIQLHDDDNFCTKCGCKASQCEPHEEPVNSFDYEETSVVIEPINENSTVKIPTSITEPLLVEQSKPKGNKKIMMSILLAIISVIIVFCILTVTHVICLNHDWVHATCAKSKHCSICGLEDGEPLEHDWLDATCEVPKTCELCGATDGGTTGHVDGDWVTTQEATLTEKGAEELLCSICGESLDSRSTARKSAKVIGTSFNFTDDELIDWLNDIANFDVGYSNVNDSTDVNTMYVISWESEIGGLILNHGDNGKNGNICAIMIYFEDWSTSVAIAAWIGEQIDSDFSADDSFVPIISGKVYSAADMSLVDVNDIIVLTPSEYLAEILD